MKFTSAHDTRATPIKQKIGFWSVNLRTGRVIWDNITAALHAMPAGHSPRLQEALAFISRADRRRLVGAALAAFESATPFDEIVVMTDARGQRKSVRIIGGRGWDAHSDEPEIHGLIEEIAAPDEHS